MTPAGMVCRDVTLHWWTQEVDNLVSVNEKSLLFLWKGDIIEGKKNCWWQVLELFL